MLSTQSTVEDFIKSLDTLRPFIESKVLTFKAAKQIFPSVFDQYRIFYNAHSGSTPPAKVSEDVRRAFISIAEYCIDGKLELDSVPREHGIKTVNNCILADFVKLVKTYNVSARDILNVKGNPWKSQIRYYSVLGSYRKPTDAELKWMRNYVNLNEDIFKKESSKYARKLTNYEINSIIGICNNISYSFDEFVRVINKLAGTPRSSIPSDGRFSFRFIHKLHKVFTGGLSVIDIIDNSVNNTVLYSEVMNAVYKGTVTGGEYDNYSLNVFTRVLRDIRFMYSVTLEVMQNKDAISAVYKAINFDKKVTGGNLYGIISYRDGYRKLILSGINDSAAFIPDIFSITLTGSDLEDKISYCNTRIDLLTKILDYVDLYGEMLNECTCATAMFRSPFASKLIYYSSVAGIIKDAVKPEMSLVLDKVVAEAMVDFLEYLI